MHKCRNLNKPQAQETGRNLRHIIIKLLKISIKEKILKAEQETQVTFTGRKIRMTDFLSETRQMSEQWSSIF